MSGIIEQGEAFKVKSKDVTPKIDASVCLAREGIAIYLEIFSSATLAIVSTDPESGFEGLENDQSISASGLAKDGTPILDSRDSSMVLDYPFRGAKSGQAYISSSYIVGRRYGKKPDGTRNVLKGWEALASYVGCSPERFRNEIQRLINEGAGGKRKVYIRFVHNLVGLVESYGLFVDDVIFSLQPWDRHPIDYNSVVNRKLARALNKPKYTYPLPVGFPSLQHKLRFTRGLNERIWTGFGSGSTSRRIRSAKNQC